MMTEYDHEPIPGLPSVPPPGETILWQGSPEWKSLARTAFHTRLVAGYFILLAAWSLISAVSGGIDAASDLVGLAMTLIAGIAAVGLLHLLAWGSARTTIYTLTNRRIVLRIGMALPKCINLPLRQVGAIDLAAHADGSGDIAMAVTGRQKLGFVALWPHARAWKLGNPQPTMRAVPDAATVAALVARTCLSANPAGQIAPPPTAADVNPAFGEAIPA
jgi:hypothetical protein